MITLGCSWTWGYGIQNDETYSAHLQNNLKNWTVINAGHSGADIDYAIFSAASFIEENNVDFVVFQLSTLDRITLGTDGFDNFLEAKYFNGKDESIYYESKEAEHKRLIGIADNIKIKYTDGSYSADIESKKHEFNSSGMKNINFEKYNNFVSVLTENVSFSTFQMQKKFMNLLMFENYLRAKKIKSLYFSYLPLPNDVYKSKYFRRFRKSVNFIDDSWKQWLNKNYPNNNFFIDSTHVSSEGNKILAEQYLAPYINKLI